MQDLLPILGIFAVFSPALMLPGPDFVVVVRNTMAHGRRNGVLTALGISIGIVLYAGLSVVGIATLLNQLAWFGSVIRILGATFLTYLGINLLFTRHAPRALESSSNTPSPRPNARNPVFLGLLVNLTNPKAIVFFASIFSTAIRPSMSPLLLTELVIALGLCGFLWFSLISMATATTGFLVSLEDHQHWIERFAGVAFLGFAAKLLVDLLR